MPQDLDITIGLDTIGRIRVHRDRVEARDSAGRPIGVFPTEEAARTAVWLDWQTGIAGGAHATAR